GTFSPGAFTPGAPPPPFLQGTGEQIAATLLPNGELLITGGNDAYPIDAAELLSIRSSPLDAFAPSVAPGSVPAPTGVAPATAGGVPVVVGGTGIGGLVDRSAGSPSGGRLGVAQATWVPLSTGLA